MMKQTATILIVAGCTLSAIADKVPAELQKLQNIRTQKVKEIDDAYINVLEKLKLQCMKRGDLDGANAVNNELMLFSEPQQAQTDSQEQIVGSNPNDSIKTISDDWETCKVSEGILVAVPLTPAALTYDQAVQEAERYGATLYFPKKRRDAERMMDLLPRTPDSGCASFLHDVKCRLRNGILEVHTLAGEIYEYDEIFKQPPYIHPALRKRPELTEGDLLVTINGKGIRNLQARKPGERANYLIILIPDDN